LLVASAGGLAPRLP